MHKLETTLLICIDQGCAEKEWPRLVVEYRHVGAYSGFVRGEPINPPEPEHVELGRIYAVIDGYHHPLPEWMVEPLTEQLERLCLDHWRGERDDAMERRAEARRDDDMLDRIERRPQAAE